MEHSLPAAVAEVGQGVRGVAARVAPRGQAVIVEAARRLRLHEGSLLLRRVGSGGRVEVMVERQTGRRMREGIAARTEADRGLRAESLDLRPDAAAGRPDGHELPCVAIFEARELVELKVLAGEPAFLVSVEKLESGRPPRGCGRSA